MASSVGSGAETRRTTGTPRRPIGAGGVGGRKRKRRGLEFRVAPDQRGGVQKRIHVDHHLLYSHDDSDGLLALAVLHASDGGFGNRSCALKPLGDDAHALVNRGRVDCLPYGCRVHGCGPLYDNTYASFGQEVERNVATSPAFA